MRSARRGRGPIFRESSFIEAGLQGLCKLPRWHNSAPPRQQLAAARIKAGRSHANASRRWLWCVVPARRKTRSDTSKSRHWYSFTATKGIELRAEQIREARTISLSLYTLVSSMTMINVRNNCFITQHIYTYKLYIYTYKLFCNLENS